MLILFDIDCTLVDTGGAGMSALTAAVIEVFGDEGPPLDLAGSTDSGIVRGLFEHFQLSYDAALEEKFYLSYLPKMEANLHDASFSGRILDGVIELLALLEDQKHPLGLMTGNIKRGAVVKASHYGLAGYFGFGSYGDDHWDRNKLGPIALERAEMTTGKKFTADETLVIGDTPKDVACAHAFDAKCVAVATGSFNEDQLRECGADLVVPNLVGFSLANLPWNARA
ncbi:MAG: HAD hydrolase-like protein [Akkermansiaceae bacterium]|nr:HAD hydrolase-like protein [Akkermansiaceae bacterium]